MDNPQYNWVNQMVKQRMKTKNKAKKLIDNIDEMNLKEDTTNTIIHFSISRFARQLNTRTMTTSI